MKLADLLTELRENILHDRSDRVEGGDDYLWTDVTLVRYINEAQRRFARRGLIIRDKSNDEATLVTLVAGQRDYTLNQSVLSVISARYEDDASDLSRIGRSAINTFAPPDDRFWDVNSLAQATPGRPNVYMTDETIGLDDNDSSGAVVLTVYPTPSAAEAGRRIRLRVIRLPIEELSANRLNAYPEIPEDHHLEMLDWAAYLALRIVDHDAGNPARAAEFRASFEAHCKQARNDVMRKLFAPTTWGFGRNGFSWER